MEMVGKIVALKRQSESARAQEILERVYRYALPLMRKHSLRVGTLTEFFPKDPNLLGINVNRGQKIAIRLRPANNPKTFIHFEDLLGTMLHELTHNLHGPHNETFFKYMDGLKSELQGMMMRGFQGDKWFSGRQLGGPPGRPGAQAQDRYASPGRAASRAAQLRHGRRLGGGVQAPVNLVRDRALAAAERRRLLDKACPADKPIFIDLTEEDDKTPPPEPPTADTLVIDLT